MKPFINVYFRSPITLSRFHCGWSQLCAENEGQRLKKKKKKGLSWN